METGACGANLDNVHAPVVEGYSFVHAPVTIQGMKVHTYVNIYICVLFLSLFCLNPGFNDVYFHLVFPLYIVSETFKIKV